MSLLQKLVLVSGIKPIFSGTLFLSLCLRLLVEHWHLQPRERRRSEWIIVTVIVMKACSDPSDSDVTKVISSQWWQYTYSEWVTRPPFTSSGQYWWVATSHYTFCFFLHDFSNMWCDKNYFSQTVSLIVLSNKFVFEDKLI